VDAARSRVHSPPVGDARSQDPAAHHSRGDFPRGRLLTEANTKPSISRPSSPAPQHAPPSALVWTLVAATLCGATLRCFRLGAQSLWIDEVLTWTSANIGGHLTLRDALENIHGPLYAAVVHAFAAWAGSSEFALRLPSAIAGILTIPAMAWLAGRWLGRESAPWAAWAAALSPFLIWYSQEARSYSMMILFVCLSGALMLELARRHDAEGGHGPRAAIAAGYGVTGIAGLLTNPSFAFVLPLHLLWWLAPPDSTRRRAPDPRPARAASRVALAVGAAVILVLVAIPWAPQAMRTWDWQRLHPGRATPAGETSLRGQTTFHAAAVPFALHAFAVGYTLGPSLRELRARPDAATLIRHAPEIVIVALVFGTLGILALRSLARRQALKDAAAWGGIPLVVVVWFALSNFKVFHPRYLAVASPLFLIAIAAALADLGARARVAFALVLLGLWAVSLEHHYFVPAYGKEDARDAAHLVASRARAEERVLAVNAIDPMVYYYHGAAPLVPFWLGFAADPGRLVSRFDQELARSRGAWVVLMRPEDLDPAGRFIGMMRARHPGVEHFEFEGVRVWHVPSGEPPPASQR
jgi:4-amino-4-deoxy-L-arabinose transferase-like glycosyltransferase